MKHSHSAFALVTLLAAAAAGVHGMNPAPDFRSVDRLKQTYLVCDHETTLGRLDAARIRDCSQAAEQLLQQAFGGDLDLLLDWWRLARLRPMANPSETASPPT